MLQLKYNVSLLSMYIVTIIFLYCVFNLFVSGVGCYPKQVQAFVQVNKR